MSKNKKIVAWMVRDDCEGHACIVMHHHGIAARREGANQLDIEFEYVDCSRAPQFDQYADQGKVPTMVLLEHGWWFECSHCGCSIMAEQLEETKDTPLDKVVIAGDHVYCNQDCKDKFDNERAERQAKFERFKETVQQARPDLTFTDFQGGGSWITMSAKFSFPGSRYGGSVSDFEANGKLEWFIANGDKAAWDAYEAQRGAA